VTVVVRTRESVERLPGRVGRGRYVEAHLDQRLGFAAKSSPDAEMRR